MHKHPRIDGSPFNSGSESRSRSASPRVRTVTSKRVVIANIPYTVNWKDLKELFRDKVGFTGFLRLFKSNGKPNGMGLMEFKTLDGAEKAIQTMHRFEIGDRSIVVREETPKDRERMAQMEYEGQRPNEPGVSNFLPIPTPNIHGNMLGSPAVAAVAAVTPLMLERMGISGPLTDSIYISNLNYKVTWQKLKDVFRVCGRVTNATVKQDADGRSRGCAVIRFFQPYEALLAVLTFNGELLLDRELRMKIDRNGTPAAPEQPLFPQTSEGFAAAARLMELLGSKGSGPAFSNVPPFMPPAMDMQQHQQPHHQPTLTANTFAALFGGNAAADLSNGQSRMMANQSAGAFLSALLGVANPGAGTNMPMGSMQHGLPGMPGLCEPTSSAQLSGSSATQMLLHGIMNAAGGGHSSNLSPAGGGMPPTGRSISAGSGSTSTSLQQLLAAAAAGGMAPGQLASAASALGISQGGFSDSKNNFDDIMGLPGGQPSNSYGNPLGVLEMEDLRSAFRSGDRRSAVDDYRDDFERALTHSQRQRSSNSDRISSQLTNRHRFDHDSSVGDALFMDDRASPASRTSHRASSRRTEHSTSDAGLLIKNIPYAFTWQDLKRIFEKVGEVSYADIVIDERGRSQGRGHIRYANPEDGERALIQMNGSSFEGRRLKVELN